MATPTASSIQQPPCQILGRCWGDTAEVVYEFEVIHITTPRGPLGKVICSSLRPSVIHDTDLHPADHHRQHPHTDHQSGMEAKIPSEKRSPSNREHGQLTPSMATDHVAVWMGVPSANDLVYVGPNPKVVQPLCGILLVLSSNDGKLMTSNPIEVTRQKK